MIKGENFKMKNYAIGLFLAITLLLNPTAAQAVVPPTLILKNQYGEESTNYVLGGTCSLPASATHTILSNLTGGTATAIANTYADVSAVLLPTQLLTGFVSGAGTISASDTTLAAIQKLSGDVQNKTVLTNVLTAFSSGAGAVTSADTVLGAFQKVVGNTQNKAILSFLSNASAGGAASEVFVVTGILATDTILSVSQSVKGTNSLPLLGYNTLAANALTGVYSADPGTAARIVVTVLR